MEFLANAGGAGEIVRIGDGSRAQSSLAAVPRAIVLDRCYLHADPATGQKRGVALNGADITIRNCWIAEIKAVGQDSQAIAGWNGPGPFTIVNNYLEGTGENVMFGGSDSPSAEMLPSDIEIRGNLFSKPEEWRLSKEWLIKNLFELKVGKRVLVEGNRVIRFAQDCAPKYGLKVSAFEVEELTPELYTEHPLVSREILGGTGAGWNSHGMHHIDAHRLDDGWIACVDGWRSVLVE